MAADSGATRQVQKTPHAAPMRMALLRVCLPRLAAVCARDSSWHYINIYVCVLLVISHNAPFIDAALPMTTRECLSQALGLNCEAKVQRCGKPLEID